jgi:hypothetical protein
MTRNSLYPGMSVAVLLAAAVAALGARQNTAAAVPIDSDDIGGVVTSAKGPEAGVWVVAETTDLPTKFTKIVVTDDRGRYVLPDLPRASYKVFVRGYGLVDSMPVTGKLGAQLDLKAVVAPDAKSAAQIYPASYWFSLLELPKGKETEFVGSVRGCLACHQLGDLATRTIPKEVGTFNSGLEAWDHRVAVGPVGPGMAGGFMRLGESRKAFADWTDRIAAGAVPTQAPARPTGVERNLVLSLWDWADATGGRSDAIATDDRKSTLNANGPVYGAIQTSDIIATLDPVENRMTNIKVPSPAPVMGIGKPSPYYGTEEIWKRTADPRSVVMDSKSRVWVASRVRPAGQGQPDFCKDGAVNKFAKYFPILATSSRQLSMYDPKTKQFTPFDTCGDADHNHFSEDGLLFFGQNNLIHWVDVPAFDRTKDSKQSQGWCPAVLDTNGDGKITEWTEPKDPIDPKKDHRIEFGCYSIAVSPLDGSAWCSGIGPRNKTLVRIDIGKNPPESCKAEVYVPPADKLPFEGSGGAGVDSNGVVWQNWRGPYQVVSFDRRKCKVTNGPTAANGDQCPEGWSVYTRKSPVFAGAEDKYRADMLYLTQVDRDNALGLGNNVALSGDINADSLVAVLPQSPEKVISLRVPYPMGFFSRSASGRIDDPKTGWKGKGVWSNFSTYAPWHVEGGKGTMPKMVKFQVRPDPLAK